MVRDMTLWFWDLPQAGQLLVNKPGKLAAPSPVCLVLHKLRDNGVCRDWAVGTGKRRGQTC